MPVFVVTHHAREPLAKEGGTTFTFVTDGIESALEQAREAADGKDVALGGGANVAQQYLRAGLIDEMQIHVVPVLLGDGARLFDNLGDAEVGLECTRRGRGPRRHPPHLPRREVSSAVAVLMTGLVFGEQPRWHEDRLWFSDWGTQEVIAVDLEGNSEVILAGAVVSVAASTGCPTGACSSSRRARGCFCAGSPTARW